MQQSPSDDQLAKSPYAGFLLTHTDSSMSRRQYMSHQSTLQRVLALLGQAYDKHKIADGRCAVCHDGRMKNSQVFGTCVLKRMHCLPPDRVCKTHTRRIYRKHSCRQLMVEVCASCRINTQRVTPSQSRNWISSQGKAKQVL